MYWGFLLLPLFVFLICQLTVPLQHSRLYYNTRILFYGSRFLVAYFFHYGASFVLLGATRTCYDGLHFSAYGMLLEYVYRASMRLLLAMRYLLDLLFRNF